MNKTLRLLILEDTASDAEADWKTNLKQAGMDFVSKRVATKADFVKQMEGFQPDLILADYSLPGFSGKSALNIVVNQYPDVPFIFVSGAFGRRTGGGITQKRGNGLCFKK